MYFLLHSVIRIDNPARLNDGPERSQTIMVGEIGVTYRSPVGLCSGPKVLLKNYFPMTPPHSPIFPSWLPAVLLTQTAAVPGHM